ncbi:MAG: TolC family protein [Bacteroidetes bacterium]|nr:TolC family protein [Bacteroidota bacterium]
MNLRQTLTVFFASAVFAITSIGNAQTRPVSLSDYLEAALKSNPLVGSAALAKESARYHSESITKGYYPQIGVGSHLIVAPGYDPAITNGGEFGAQISGSYTIYDGGARSLEIRRGGIGVEQGTVNQSRVRADIIYSVSTAYIDAVREERELDVVEQEYRSLSDYLRLVNQLHASGQGSETDVLRTTVDLNNAQIEINSRKISYKNSLVVLAQASGLPTSEVTEVDSVMPSLSYYTTFVPARNVDLMSEHLMLKQAELDAQIAESKLRPTVSIGADAGALTSLPNLQPGLANVFGASVGISVSVPVFTLGSLHDSYSAAEATAKSVALQNEYSRSVLERQFELTLNEIAGVDAQIAALGDNLVVAEKNMLLSKAQYAGGIGISLDVLNAIQMVNRIRLALEEARASRELGVLKLNRINYSGVY